MSIELAVARQHCSKLRDPAIHKSCDTGLLTYLLKIYTVPSLLQADGSLSPLLSCQEELSGQTGHHHISIPMVVTDQASESSNSANNGSRMKYWEWAWGNTDRLSRQITNSTAGNTFKTFPISNISQGLASHRLHKLSNVTGSVVAYA